jgi:hypothetical protein
MRSQNQLKLLIANCNAVLTELGAVVLKYLHGDGGDEEVGEE